MIEGQRATYKGRQVTIEEIDLADRAAWVLFTDGRADWVGMEELDLEVTPGHPVKAGAGYDCACGECLAMRNGLGDWGYCAATGCETYIPAKDNYCPEHHMY